MRTSELQERPETAMDLTPWWYQKIPVGVRSRFTIGHEHKAHVPKQLHALPTQDHETWPQCNGATTSRPTVHVHLLHLRGRALHRPSLRGIRMARLRWQRHDEIFVRTLLELRKAAA